MPLHHEKIWIEELNAFISDEENEADRKSIRNLSLKILSDLIELYKDKGFIAFL